VGKAPRSDATKKPPAPSESHAAIDDWMRRVMPDLHPIVTSLDRSIREAIPDARFAVKWRRAYYGLADLGWLIEVVPYDVSVNVVFLAGAEFDPRPPLGTAGRTRYIKVKTVEEAQAPEVRGWIEQAKGIPGWR
jgi:hypothetical protein